MVRIQKVGLDHGNKSSTKGSPSWSEGHWEGAILFNSCAGKREDGHCSVSRMQTQSTLGRAVKVKHSKDSQTKDRVCDPLLEREPVEHTQHYSPRHGKISEWDLWQGTEPGPDAPTIQPGGTETSEVSQSFWMTAVMMMPEAEEEWCTGMGKSRHPPWRQPQPLRFLTRLTQHPGKDMTRFGTTSMENRVMRLPT